MEIYFGAKFEDYSLRRIYLRDLLDRAVMKGIITLAGATYMEEMK